MHFTVHGLFYSVFYLVFLTCFPSVFPAQELSTGTRFRSGSARSGAKLAVRIPAPARKAPTASHGPCTELLCVEYGFKVWGKNVKERIDSLHKMEF